MWNPFADWDWDKVYWSIDFQSWTGINVHNFVEIVFIVLTCIVLAVASLMQLKGGSAAPSSSTSQTENTTPPSPTLQTPPVENLEATNPPTTTGGRMRRPRKKGHKKHPNRLVDTIYHHLVRYKR